MTEGSAVYLSFVGNAVTDHRREYDGGCDGSRHVSTHERLSRHTSKLSLHHERLHECVSVRSPGELSSAHRTYIYSVREDDMNEGNDEAG